MKLRENLFIFMSFLYTTSCLWVVLPSFDINCGGPRQFFPSEMIADLIQPGCEKQSLLRKSMLGKFRPTRRIFSAKRFSEPNYPAGTVFEWKLWAKKYGKKNRLMSFYDNRHLFRNPDFKVIFRWNEREDVCTPLRIIAFGKPGEQEVCTIMPHQPGRLIRAIAPNPAPIFAPDPAPILAPEAENTPDYMSDALPGYRSSSSFGSVDFIHMFESARDPEESFKSAEGSLSSSSSSSRTSNRPYRRRRKQRTNVESEED